MGVYVFIEAIVGVIAGILIAVLTKRAEGVKYGKLDKVGIVTNILLIPVYVFTFPLYLFIGLVCHPAYDGLLGILGWIVSIFCASVALFCCLGLGASVALRKKGKSILSFVVQFAGVVAFGLMFLLFALLYGNLLSTLN